MDSIMRLVIIIAILTLFIAIIAFSIRWTWGSISRINEMRKKQNLSVMARWRNRITQKMWKDLMDIRIAGIVPVGESVENFLMAMFPQAMGDLEEMRKKNPVAWRETMVYLLPLFVRIKATAHYKGREGLESIIQSIQETIEGIGQGNNSTDKNDNPDNNKRET